MTVDRQKAIDDFLQKLPESAHKKVSHSDTTEKLVEALRDINHFYEIYDKIPDSDSADLSERRLAAKLNRMQNIFSDHGELKPYDKYNILMKIGVKSSQRRASNMSTEIKDNLPDDPMSSDQTKTVSDSPIKNEAQRKINNFLSSLTPDLESVYSIKNVEKSKKNQLGMVMLQSENRVTLLKSMRISLKK